ncbi:MAG: patatin-like phospholipase family protein [Planctomycetes bacterium]|nr:patatin-like phospholipase family protein [Planctomycetota bacterium]
MNEPSADVTAATRLIEAGATTSTPDLLGAILDRDGNGKHLIDRLRATKELVAARDVLDLAFGREDAPDDRAEQIRQLYALCLYKDPDLPAKQKLDQAFEKLLAGADLATCQNTETLGLAGAISRRYWNLDGHSSHLERALRYYENGHALVVKDAGHAAADRGFCGINAAFLLDQLAKLGEEAGFGADPSGVERLRRDQAARIRREILGVLTKLQEKDANLLQDWWVVATMVEANFGLGYFARARDVFVEHGAANAAPWQIETTLKQLVALARLHGHVDPLTRSGKSQPARDCLKAILGDRDPELLLIADQKVGLALSGGGFRASFYEIGVLAALAEFDLLRHVEVLSTVSGGSVLGAHYYLEVRNLLTQKPSRDIGRGDYIALVKRVIDDFFVGVENNIRTRVIANPIDTARMLISSSYSRTMKAGELYEDLIYRRIAGIPDGPIRMRDLIIQPPDEDPGFKPNAGNWQRNAKVPILVLNATSLNTGHNWQFTARWMGEPLVETDIDSNPRLRRMNYDQLQGTPAAAHRDFRLGHAVAASACVPGLFEPIALRSLYEDTGSGEPKATTVRLVDGGVHDNQGLESLLEQDCNVLIAADASGQMTYDREPSTSVLGGVLRSNSTMMARIREAQYRDVKVQREVGRRKGFAFVHLKDGLHGRPVNWQGCKASEAKDGTENPHTASIAERVTPYGIRKSAQEKIAAIRTDLDSFSQVEAWSLMYSGYRATRAAIPGSITTLPLATAVEDDWAFLQVAAALTAETADSAAAKRLERHLEVGQKGAFKVWHLNGLLSALRWLITVGGGLALLWWTYDKDVTIVSLDSLWWFAVGTLATWALGKWFMNLVRPKELVTKILMGIAITLVGWIVAQTHLQLFDKLFKKLGRVERR